MKATKIKLTALRNDEHFQFISQFIVMLTVIIGSLTRVKALVDRLLALHKEEDDVLKLISKSARTAQIHDLDAERDSLFRGMAEANRSACHHFKAVVREAAVRLRIVFDTYGDVTHKAINEETSALYNLTDELAARHAADVEAVGIGPWIAELDRVNNALDKLMLERHHEEAGQSALVLRDVRRRVDAAYRDLVQCVESLSMMENGGPDGVYAGFIADVNSVIDRANMLLAARRSRAEAKKENE